MNNQTYILIGKSGSGKGTQAELLLDALAKQGIDMEHIEMGDAFRHFLRESSYTSTKAHKIAEEGGLQPDFLANYFLAGELIKYANGERGFIFDGTPRTKRQARIVDGALRFYGIENPVVIHLRVSDESVIERMKDRGRSDDEISSIKTRLEWFEQDTMRAIEFFQERNDYYSYIELDGEQDIDTIHTELMNSLEQL